MANKPNTASGKGQLYRWDDGRGRVHTRKQKVRKPAPRKPAPVDPLVTQANQMTALRYGQPEAQLATRQSQVAPWFQQYQAQIGAQQQATAAQNQPLINQAYTAAQNSGTPTLKDQGVDPNSDASKNDMLAAAAREALGNAAAGQLAAIQANANAYFGKQQSVVAPMYQQSVSTDIGNQQQQLAAEKGQYRDTTIGDLRDTAQKNMLEQALFNVNTADKAADNARADKQVRSSNRNQRLNRRASQKSREGAVNTYGYTAKEWASFSPAKRQQEMAKVKAQNRAPKTPGAKGLTPAQQRAAQKGRNKAITRISDIGDNFNLYSRQTNVDPNTKKTIKPTRDQVISQLRKDGFSMSEIKLGLKVRDRTLTRADVRLAKRLGIWPLPKGWKKLVLPSGSPSGGKPSGGAVGTPYGTGAGQVH